MKQLNILALTVVLLAGACSVKGPQSGGQNNGQNSSQNNGQNNGADNGQDNGTGGTLSVEDQFLGRFGTYTKLVKGATTLDITEDGRRIGAYRFESAQSDTAATYVLISNADNTITVVFTPAGTVEIGPNEFTLSN